MYQLVHCARCDKTGNFDLHLEFYSQRQLCKTCYNIQSNNWDYWFCNIDCMSSWISENRIYEEGFPCRNCIDPSDMPTGICDLCKGTKRVKRTITESKCHDQPASGV